MAKQRSGRRACSKPRHNMEKQPNDRRVLSCLQMSKEASVNWVGVNYQKHRKEKVRMVMELVRGVGDHRSYQTMRHSAKGFEH